jgi:hypothetical protein
LLRSRFDMSTPLSRACCVGRRITAAIAPLIGFGGSSQLGVIVSL